MAVEDMRYEASMCPEPLTCHSIGHALFLFCHVANMISLRIHNDIFIRLLEPTREMTVSSVFLRIESNPLTS